MNINRIIVRMAAMLLFVGAVACSGEKKEASEGHDQHEAAKVEVAPLAQIKAFEEVDASIKDQLNGFLNDYYALNQALIEDNQDGAKAAAKKLNATVDKFDMSKLMGDQMTFYHAQLALLNNGLKGINESSDIEETRLELAPVSEAMYALVKAYRPNESEIYYQFCPMAKNGEGATWISGTKEIINPYMGQRMLKCGSTRETL